MLPAPNRPLSPSPSPLRRSTRIVCISDTHSTHPALPSGDILIHAGSLTNSGTYASLHAQLTWLSSAPGFKAKIIVAGTHDITLDAPFYQQYGKYFHHHQHRPSLQDPAACTQLMSDICKSTEMVFLHHSSQLCKLQNPDGTLTQFKVFGSPHSPSRALSAFSYAPESASRLWSAIPLDADIVITQTPPRYHCDESVRGAVGCEELRRALWRVRPGLVVCGGVEEGWGVETVEWDLGARNARWKEMGSFGWDVARTRVCRVDLTRGGGRPLRNDGGKGRLGSIVADSRARGREVSPDEVERENEKCSLGAIRNAQHDGPLPEYEDARFTKPFPQSELAERPIPPMAQPRPVHPSTHGIGGLPVTGRCDVEALAGREGRKETCVINASIAAPHWGHQLGSRRMLGKPIVVDIDLPVVEKRVDWFEEQQQKKKE